MSPSPKTQTIPPHAISSSHPETTRAVTDIKNAFVKAKKPVLRCHHPMICAVVAEIVRRPLD
jgi:hypothetical protein